MLDWEVIGFFELGFIREGVPGGISSKMLFSIPRRLSWRIIEGIANKGVKPYEN